MKIYLYVRNWTRKSAGFDRIVKREMCFTSTRYVFASLFVLSFSIQSETYIEHDPNFAFLFVSPTFSLFLLLFLCAFSCLWSHCYSMAARALGEIKMSWEKGKKDWKCLGSQTRCCTRDKKHKSCFIMNHLSRFIFVTCSALWAITKFVARVELHAHYCPKLRNQNGQLTETMDLRA